MTDQGLIDLLTRLVSIPSVNPEDTDDPAITGEGRLAEFFAAYLDERGFEITWDDRASGRPNVIARYGAPDAPRSLLLESHLDTVSIKGMTRPAFEAVIEGGRLYGRGACDTKGPMAAAMWALGPDALEGLTGAGFQVIFVGAMGEEKGNHGATHLAEQGLGADEALILEPTELAIVRAHKGTLWYRVRLDGVAGHGSDPDRGISAIAAAAPLMTHLQEQIMADQRKHSDPLLGTPTVNVGVIRGGAAINIVPSHCMMEIDRRTVPGEEHVSILERVRAVLEDMRREGLLRSYDLEIIKDGPAFSTAERAVLVSKLKDACVASGIGARVEGTAWYSDAGAFAKTCGEVAVFGPGSIKQAHTADEYIDLDSLQKGCDVLRRFFTMLGTEEDPLD